MEENIMTLEIGNMQIEIPEKLIEERARILHINSQKENLEDIKRLSDIASWYQTGINVAWEKWCVQSLLILSNKPKNNKQTELDNDRDER